MEEFDPSYLVTTGRSQRYYLEDMRTIAFHPVPSWSSSYIAFTQDMGELIQCSVDGTNYTFDSEFGVVIDAIDTVSSIIYTVDYLNGEVVAIDDSLPRVDVAYIYQPARIVNDSDVPDLPTHYQWMMIYGILGMLFEADTQGKDTKLAAYWNMRYEEVKKEWRARNLENMHVPDQYLSQRPIRWGADLDWRERVNP